MEQKIKTAGKTAEEKSNQETEAPKVLIELTEQQLDLIRGCVYADIKRIERKYGVGFADKERECWDLLWDVTFKVWKQTKHPIKLEEHKQ